MRYAFLIGLIICFPVWAECTPPQSMSGPLTSGPTLPEAYTQEIVALQKALRLAFIHSDEHAAVFNRGRFNEALFAFNDRVAKLIAKGQHGIDQADEAKRWAAMNCPL